MFNVATIDRIVRLGGASDGPVRAARPDRPRRHLQIARSFFAQGGEPERWRPSPIQDKLVAEGRLGRKSGHGDHAYGERHEREPDPDLGIPAPTLDPDKLGQGSIAAGKILPRLFAQIANEAAFAIERRSPPTRTWRRR